MEPIDNFNERDDYKIKSWDEFEDEHFKIIMERLNNGEIVD